MHLRRLGQCDPRDLGCAPQVDVYSFVKTKTLTYRDLGDCFFRVRFTASHPTTEYHPLSVMNKVNRSSKGFTLVEIMIVVVIIGLLAAMAIPAFQKVRRDSIEKTVINDGRQVGSAAQQYMMEHGVSQVATSELIGEGRYIRALSKGVTLAGSAVDVNATFQLNHQFASIQFGPDGNNVVAKTLN